MSMNAKQAHEQSTKNREAILAKGIANGLKQFDLALQSAVQGGLHKTTIILPTGGPIEGAVRDEVKAQIASQGFMVCDSDDGDTDEGRVEVSWSVPR